MCTSIFGLEKSGRNSPRTNQRVLEEDPTCRKNCQKPAQQTRGNQWIIGPSKPHLLGHWRNPRTHPRIQVTLGVSMAYLTSQKSCTSPMTSFIAYMYEKQCGIKTFHTKYLETSFILQIIENYKSQHMSFLDSRKLGTRPIEY